MMRSRSSQGAESAKTATDREIRVYRRQVRASYGGISIRRSILVVISFLAAAVARLGAQGGPPMITDDPGTPGNGHWEINLAWTDQQSPGSTLLGLPLLDANYGLGDRLQFNYQASWNVISGSTEPSRSGLSDSQVALKWRFYDAGDTGLQVSTYPRLTFQNPDSNSDRRGTADPGSSVLFPFEVRKDFGILSVNADFGRTFSAEADDRGWMGGLCVGREVAKGWEVDAEAHMSASQGLQHSEVILNAGTRYDVCAHGTLLLALGRDARNSLGPRASLLAYVGLQIRL